MTMKTPSLRIGDDPGQEMHDFVRHLFPICRSLTGPGTRETLGVLQQHLPDLKMHEVDSGTDVFDWTVPPEWTIRSAVLFGPDGEKIVDMVDHNLHVMGYSEPVDTELSLEDLQSHLYSLPEQPDAIPYITSYYNRRWGFCMTDAKRKTLKPGLYRAVIDADLEPGKLNYGDLVIPGETTDEVFVSTYVCHPSMANNELSGPAVATWLAKWVKEAPRRYTYRFVFIPETIGSLVYLSRHLDHLRSHVKAGFNVSCVGDDRCYSFMPSRQGDSLADRAACHVLSHHAPDHIKYSFLERGSDERQYCAPGVDLPVASVMRSKYGEYPEYHTSLDNLDLVTPTGLMGTFEALRKCLQVIEANNTWQATMIGEPQLGKRGLYPTVSVPNGARKLRNLMHMLAYCDGTKDLIDIADTIGAEVLECADLVDQLSQHDLLRSVD
jgi:aminopeptidase-like protein